MYQDPLTSYSINVTHLCWVSMGCGFAILIQAEQPSVIVLLKSLKSLSELGST